MKQASSCLKGLFQNTEESNDFLKRFHYETNAFDLKFSIVSNVRYLMTQRNRSKIRILSEGRKNPLYLFMCTGTYEERGEKMRRLGTGSGQLGAAPLTGLLTLVPHVPPAGQPKRNWSVEPQSDPEDMRWKGQEAPTRQTIVLRTAHRHAILPSWLGQEESYSLWC